MVGGDVVREACRKGVARVNLVDAGVVEADKKQAGVIRSFVSGGRFLLDSMNGCGFTVGGGGSGEQRR